MRLISAFVCVGLLGGILACDKKPASLSVEPREFLPLEKKGKTVQLKAQTKDEKGIFVATVNPSWSSGDETVATVDDKGLITAVGTGKTEITGTHEGLSAKVPVEVRVVGSVTLEPSTPQKLRMGKSMKVKVIVKDDKGNVLPNEKFIFKTAGYTVEAEPDGTITGVATGECELIAVAKDKEARLKFDVTD